MSKNESSSLQEIVHNCRLGEEGKITSEEFLESSTNTIFNELREIALRHGEDYKAQLTSPKEEIVKEAISDLNFLLTNGSILDVITNKVEDLFGEDYSIKRWSYIRQAIIEENASPNKLTPEQIIDADKWLIDYYEANEESINNRGFELINLKTNPDIVKELNHSDKLSFNLGSAKLLVEPYSVVAKNEAIRIGYNQPKPREPLFTKEENKRHIKAGVIGVVSALALTLGAWVYVNTRNKPIIVKEGVNNYENMEKVLTALEKDKEEREVYKTEVKKEREKEREKTNKEKQDLVALIDSARKQDKEDMAVLLENHRKELEKKDNEIEKKDNEKADLAVEMAKQTSLMKEIAEREPKTIIEKTVIKKYEINGNIGSLQLKGFYNDTNAKKEYKRLMKNRYMRIDNKLQEHYNKALENYVESEWGKSKEGKDAFNSVDSLVQTARKTLKSDSDIAPFEAMRYLKKAQEELDKIKDKNNKDKVNQATGVTLFRYGDKDNHVAGYDTAKKIATILAGNAKTQIEHYFNLSHESVKKYNSFFTFDPFKFGVKFEEDVYLEKPQKKIDDSQFEYNRRIKRWESTTKKEKESITTGASLNRVILEKYSRDSIILELAVKGYETNKAILDEILNEDEEEALEHLYKRANKESIDAEFNLGLLYAGKVSGIGRPTKFEPIKVKNWHEKRLQEVIEDMKL